MQTYAHIPPCPNTRLPPQQLFILTALSFPFRRCNTIPFGLCARAWHLRSSQSLSTSRDLQLILGKVSFQLRSHKPVWTRSWVVLGIPQFSFSLFRKFCNVQMCPAESVCFKGKSHTQIYNNDMWSALEGLISDSAVLMTDLPLTNATTTTLNNLPPTVHQGKTLTPTNPAHLTPWRKRWLTRL